ncbi:GNAT family N-acetyltransferase [Rhodovibrionaceae bacterium A322]
MPFSLRPMEIADIPETLRVRTSTHENPMTLAYLEETYGITPQSMAEAMKATVRGWVTEVPSTAGGSPLITGFCMGDLNSAEIQVLAVHPDFEGQGMGLALLRAAQERLFAAGHEELWLMANPDPAIRAYAFYRREGWVATGEIRKEDEVMVLKRPG